MEFTKAGTGLCAASMLMYGFLAFAKERPVLACMTQNRDALLNCYGSWEGSRSFQVISIQGCTPILHTGTCVVHQYCTPVHAFYTNTVHRYMR